MPTTESRTPRVEDHFDDGDDYEYALDEAEKHAKTEWEMTFVEGLRQAWRAYGMRAFLSTVQYEKLTKLARLY